MLLGHAAIAGERKTNVGPDIRPALARHPEGPPAHGLNQLPRGLDRGRHGRWLSASFAGERPQVGGDIAAPGGRECGIILHQGGEVGEGHLEGHVVLLQKVDAQAGGQGRP